MKPDKLIIGLIIMKLFNDLEHHCDDGNICCVIFGKKGGEEIGTNKQQQQANDDKQCISPRIQQKTMEARIVVCGSESRHQPAAFSISIIQLWHCTGFLERKV